MGDSVGSDDALEQYRFELNRVAINKAMKLLDKIRLEWGGVSRSRSKLIAG